jgi:SWI/SNF-related matrix-associated actin-dependent regulator of chromatin subfamily A member 5
MSHSFGPVDFSDVEPDELDVIASSRSSTTLIGDGSPPVQEEKPTIRLRVSPSRNDLQSGEDIQMTGKRVRTSSFSAIDNGTNSQKKQKMQDKKAVRFLRS